MTLPRLLRFGLRQFAAGMLSVLAVGILNRVMKVEMGLGLALVAVVVGAHYFAAPIAIPLGHRSDRRPLFGYHRTPYILAGAALTMLATVTAPHAALWIEAAGGALWAAALGALVFLALGVGIYTAGTAYLSLLADLTPEAERGRAVSIVWSMMMFGILAGVFLGVGLLDDYSPARLIRLFEITALAVGALTVVALWGQERRAAVSPSEQATDLGRAWSLLRAAPQTARFFVFLTGSILFLFLQQVVLEPFGGDVFGMSIRQTTLFNAWQMLGVLSGMAVAGAWLARRLGDRLTAGIGLALAAAAFGGLGGSALLRQPGLVTPSIVGMGLGMGLFNVGGLAMMMGMTTQADRGAYMGAWTLAQALANGLASVGGGGLQDFGARLLGSEAAAYGGVFLIEAAGLAGCILLLRSISVAEFRRQASRKPVASAETAWPRAPAR